MRRKGERILIRILHFCSDSNIGGAGVCLLRLLSASDKDKFEHYAVIPQNSLLKDRFLASGVNVILYYSSPDRSFSVSQIKEFIKLIQKLNPHIVHTHGSFSARIAAKLANVRSRIYTRHTYCEKKYSSPFRFLNRAVTTKAVAVNAALVPQLKDSGIKEDNILVIENACERISVDGPCKNNENEDSWSLLFLGRIVKGKGLDTAIKAIKKLNCSKYSVTLTVAGEGDYKDEMVSLAKRIGVSDYVRFLPFQNDITQCIYDCDIAINCSYRDEATSNFVIEAMSASKPVLLSNVGGNLHIIDDGVEGMFFLPGNVDSFCVALKRMISDRKVYLHLSENAEKKYLARFTLERMITSYQKLWTEEYDRYYK